MSTTPPPRPPDWAIEAILDSYERAQATIRAKPDHPPECDDCERADRMSAAAREELRQLRQRNADLELMLRGFTRTYYEDGAAMDCNGIGWFWRANRDQAWRSLGRGADGLPLLTPEAREKLGGKK